MPRGLTSAVQTELESGSYHPFWAVEINYTDIPREAVRVWTGIGTLRLIINRVAWDFAGVGTLGSIEPIKETSELKAERIGLSLSGIPSDIIAHTQTNSWHGRPLRIWFGLLDDDRNVIADPKIFALGRLDTMNIQSGAETSTIKITAESPLIDADTPRDTYFTSEYQKTLYPMDRGLDFVPSLQNQEIDW